MKCENNFLGAHYNINIIQEKVSDTMVVTDYNIIGWPVVLVVCR